MAGSVQKDRIGPFFYLGIIYMATFAWCRHVYKSLLFGGSFRRLWALGAPGWIQDCGADTLDLFYDLIHPGLGVLQC